MSTKLHSFLINLKQIYVIKLLELYNCWKFIKRYLKQHFSISTETEFCIILECSILLHLPFKLLSNTNTKSSFYLRVKLKICFSNESI